MTIGRIFKFLFISSLLFFGLVFLLIAVFGGGMGKDKVAVVNIKGIITDSKDAIEQLHEAAEDSSVKAIIIRINSPGGGVGASQEIYREVTKIKDKKVLVSMGSVAASGGYYIACGAEKIYANPGTLTGSIGVLMEFANFEELFGKIGLKGFVLKSGEFKDSGSPLRPMTDAERKLLQGVIDNTYGQFVSAVAAGRKLPEEQVRKLADGRIYTGQQAKENRLVDELGNLDDAIDEAARMAGIKGKPLVKDMTRKRFTFFTFLFGDDSEAVLNNVLNTNAFGLNYLYIPGR